MLEDIIAPLLSTKWGHYGSLAAIFTISLLLLITFIEIPLTWRNDFIMTQATPATLGKASQVLADESLVLIKQIPNWHLFGSPPLAAYLTTLPITSLQLHLVGIVQAVSANRSRAIISIAGQPGKIYQPGDTLVAGVKINRIAADNVTLENGGRLEKLPLARPPLLFQNLLPKE
jgi:type II secretory pathway component PulC